MSRLSIRWRITLWNTVAFAVVLAGFGVLVYRLLRKIHYDHVDRGLQARHLELDKAIELGREPVAAAVGWVGRLEKRGYVDGMVRNLIDNAIKYSDRGDRIDVRLRRSGDEAIVEVRDTGIGIPPEHPPRLFDRFYRAARDGSRHDGAGLGLSIAHGAVVASGGRIEVESEVGKGTAFRIVLPITTRRW